MFLFKKIYSFKQFSFHSFTLFCGSDSLTIKLVSLSRPKKKAPLKIFNISQYFVRPGRYNINMNSYRKRFVFQVCSSCADQPDYCPECENHKDFVCTCQASTKTCRLCLQLQTFLKSSPPRCGEKIVKGFPDKFNFKDCRRCRLSARNPNLMESEICDDCLQHRKGICLCSRLLPQDKCLLCVQLDYFRKFPHTWNYYYERKLPKFTFIFCEDCVRQQKLIVANGKFFTPCDTCRHGVVGPCALSLRQRCRVCPYCRQYEDYLKFINAHEANCPF